ncbi:MAG: lysine 5,6-aminomutase subunit alpha, partial [Ornithinimicrobium sp.]
MSTSTTPALRPSSLPPRLDLDPETVRRARALTARLGQPVVQIARQHTTVSVERATLRLAGLRGADHERVPWVNHLLDRVREQVGIEHGVALPVWDALCRAEAPDLLTLAQKASAKAVRFRMPRESERARARAAATAAVGVGMDRIDAARVARGEMVRR